MKNILFTLFSLTFLVCFSQKNDLDINFKQPHLTLESCEDKSNSKCFDNKIKTIVTSIYEDSFKQYCSKHPDKKTGTILLLFIVNDKGQIIKESIKTSKNKNLKLKNQLIDSLSNLSGILPRLNEHNYPIFSYFNKTIEFNFENGKLSTEQIDTGKVIPKNSDTTPPIYPGCERYNNEGKKKCFEHKVQTFISKNFNANKALRGFNKKGTFFIFGLFKVGKSGEIINIQAFGPNEKLISQGKKVLKKLKNIKPGTYKGEAINVPYTVPLRLILE